MIAEILVYLLLAVIAGTAIYIAGHPWTGKG